MTNFKVNVDFPRKPVQGDNLEATLTVDANLTDYKCRVQITDDENSNVQLATTNSGGNSGEVTISSGTSSTITIVVPKDNTDSLTKECHIEVELEDANGKVFTIWQKYFTLYEENITWTSPSS